MLENEGNMNKELIDNRINEIVEWAQDNDNYISRRIAYDIIKEKNNDISEEEILEVMYEIERQGIEIIDNDDEGYTDKNESDDSFIPADVNISMRTVSLDAIVSRLKNDEIDLFPDFQRLPNLWNYGQKSRLIESLMLRIPIPAFYFDAPSENKWIVIDGLQRLSAIKGFIVDENYRLSELEYLKEFNGCSFEELPRQYIRRINETQLTIYTVEKGTPKRIVFNIFQRLNTGGLTLTAQEIRHALNQGPVIHLIKEMADSDEFKGATGYSIKSRRMLDCEYATRFLAFYTIDISEYTGSIDDFLDDAMVQGNKMNESEAQKVISEYKRTLKHCRLIFGNYAFRRIKDDGTRGPINKALFETFTWNISQMKDESLYLLGENQDYVRAKYKELFQSNFSKYLKASDKYTLNKRMQLTKEFIGDLLNVK